MRASFCLSSFSSPWPDPNSHVLSKIDFGLPLVELFKWLCIVDALLGHNYKKQDITAALTLARVCNHPDAVWLTSVFEGNDISTKEDAREVFLLNQNDARALCFAWCLGTNHWSEMSMLQRAAETGDALASAFFCSQQPVMSENGGRYAFRLAQHAALQHDRDGLYRLGNCFENGFGCEKDLKLAKEKYLIAAELGHIEAADAYGRLVGECDPACWIWWGRAAMHGRPLQFLDSFPKQVEELLSGSGNAVVVFLIGLALKESIDMETKQIFESHGWVFHSLIGLANRAISFYRSQIKSARLAVDTWTQVSTRLNLIKDMRIYIGKMIWEARFEANYKI